MGNAPPPDKVPGTRERLLAPLADIGWQAYDALLYLAGAAITIALHLGLMMVTVGVGEVMQRLVIETAVDADSELAAVAVAANDALVLVTSLFIAGAGLLKVSEKVWRDFRDRT